MANEMYWSWVCQLCRRAVDEQGKDIHAKISKTYSCDPLMEFEYADTSKHIFRFVVYILWLKSQPEALKWFEKIREEYRDLVDRRVFELSLWYPDIKCEQEV